VSPDAVCSPSLLLLSLFHIVASASCCCLCFMMSQIHAVASASCCFLCFMLLPSLCFYSAALSVRCHHYCRLVFFLLLNIIIFI
jgi:hypothetical protein